jgi:hypothetical protein
MMTPGAGVARLVPRTVADDIHGRHNRRKTLKKIISAVAVVILSTAVSAAAAGVSQDRIPELQRPGTTDDPGITLTGCVARGTTNDSYTLLDAKKSATVASGASTPREPVALSGTAVDMSKHVGHSVEVTGTYPSIDLTTGTSGTAASATTEPGKRPAKAFTVKSLKMVATSCSTAS